MKEVKKKRSKKSLRIVIAVVIVSSALIAFMPLAAVEISSFTITPVNMSTDVTSAYEVVLTTTAEFTSLNITLPAGFSARTPTDSELIARVDLWNNTLYYGYVTFTANGSSPSTKVDVSADIGGDTAEATTGVDYSAGGTTNVGSPFGGASHATLTLPSDSAEGSLSVSLPMGMRDVSVTIKEFVKNPATGGIYIFDITVDGFSYSDDVFIGTPGDTDGDGEVHEKDAWVLRQTYDTAKGDPNYNSKADFDNDDDVDLADAVLLGLHFT